MMQIVIHRVRLTLPLFQQKHFRNLPMDNMSTQYKACCYCKTPALCFSIHPISCLLYKFRAKGYSLDFKQQRKLLRQMRKMHIKIFKEDCIMIVYLCISVWLHPLGQIKLLMSKPSNWGHSDMQLTALTSKSIWPFEPQMRTVCIE